MSAFLRIEEQKSKLIEELDRWTPQRLLFKPGATEWSALQMLDHIIRTEREILLVVYRNQHLTQRVGAIDRLRTRFLHSVFRTERRVKVPASAAVVLPGAISELHVLAIEWSEVRASLAQHLGEPLDGSLGRAVFRHPVGGWMDMQGVLEFLSVHLLHHGFQLERLRIASENSQTPQGR